MADLLLSVGRPLESVPESYIRRASQQPNFAAVEIDGNIPIVDLGSPDKSLIVSQVGDTVHDWRDHLRLHCHPLEEYLAVWPSKPLAFSTADQYEGKYSRLEKNSGKNVHKRKHDSLLRIEKPKLKKERKKKSMFEVKVLDVKQKNKRRLVTSCDIELDWYLSSKRLKVDKDVNGTTACSRNSEEKGGGRVEEAPDYMEVEPDYMEVEPDYMEVEPMKHWDMLMDSVTRLMNSLSLVEHSECKNLHSDMSIDDITNLTIDLNLVEQLNQLNLRMDMSVDDITNLMTGLSLTEHSDHILDMCIEDIRNLMKALSLTTIKRSRVLLY